MHGAAVSMDGGGHGSSLPGKKGKSRPKQGDCYGQRRKILRKELDAVLSRFEQHVDPAAIPSMEMQITDRLVAQSVLRQFVLKRS